MNDESHLGLYDIPFLSHIPNFVYLAPTNKEELVAMTNWAIDQPDHRLPFGFRPWRWKQPAKLTPPITAT